VNDDEWYTCRTCGVTQEQIDNKRKSREYIHNYVLDGKCHVCRDKEDIAYDFATAKKEGEVTRDDSIMCPYCGDVISDDLYDYHEDRVYECEECGKTSDLSVDYTVHFTTVKQDDEGDEE